MIRALFGTSVVALLVACSGAPPGDGGGGGQGGGGGELGAGGPCEIASSDSARAAFVLLDERHQELTEELAEDLEDASMEEQREIFTEMAAIDEACLAVFDQISFPPQVDQSVRPTRGALEDLAATRRAVADAGTGEEFEAAVARAEDALRDWQMWRNLFLTQLPQ